MRQMIVLEPSQIMDNVVFSTDKRIKMYFMSDWDYGHITMVDNLTFEIGYVYGYSKIFPAGTMFNFANGGMSNMAFEVEDIL